MKTAKVDLVHSYPASRMPDGRLVADNSGKIDWWFRQSMWLAIPDTATAWDVNELGWNYLYEAAYWLQIDWEPIGDSEDGKEYRQEYSVVLAADDPSKAHVTLIHDGLTGNLKIEDDWLHEKAELFMEVMQELYLKRQADAYEKRLDPWQEETRSKGQRPQKPTWEQQDRWKRQ